MKLVTKYNLFKGISLALTAGVPLTTAALVSDFFVKTANTSISTAGVIALLITGLIMKDKLMEQIKSPSAFKICATLLIIIWLLESIILPMKAVLIASCIALGLDVVVLKQLYTRAEALLGSSAAAYKHFGFICCKTKTITGEE